jgi:ribosomal protein S18 acetylase RimI-like enzyme
MVIRPAGITDIDKMLVLEEQIFRLHSKARSDWVDETNIKEIVNHQVFRDMRNLEIEDLCVDEKYRGKGIGKKLFEEAIKHGKENGVKFIELSVWEFNQNAKIFYEHAGMKVKTNRMELNISG